MTVPEVKNRATITGAIEIGRHPGVVQVTFRAPVDRLEAPGLLSFVQDQYGSDHILTQRRKGAEGAQRREGEVFSCVSVSNQQSIHQQYVIRDG